MPKRRDSLRRKISRKAVVRRCTGEKRSASKELFEEKFEKKTDMDIMEEENNHGNNMNTI